MDFHVISEWLRNSIPGIIFLGMAGSIGALFLIKSLKIFPAIKKIYKKREGRLGTHHGYIYGFVIGSKNIDILFIYLAYRVGRLSILNTLFISLLVLFYVFLSKASEQLLTAGTFITIFLATIVLRFIYEEYRYLKAFYLQAVNPIVEKIDKGEEGEES